MITFEVSQVEPAPERKQALDRDQAIQRLLHQRIEAKSEGRGRLVCCSDANQLAMAVHDAFYEHRPLTLSPDAIWFCIAQGLTHHVGQNVESLRKRLVQHDGVITLVVERLDFVLGQPNPWPEALSAFSDQIAAQVGKARDVVVCEFSTTGGCRASRQRSAADGHLPGLLRIRDDHRLRDPLHHPAGDNG